jgi:hypothetical protein
MCIDKDADDFNTNPYFRDQIKLAILSVKNDKSRTVSIKEISVKDFRTMTNRITERLSSNTDHDTIFENILQILKEYNLID